MADKANLPASSKREIEKIIKAYGIIGKEADLQDLSNRTGIGRTAISPNNPFLVDVNIITTGQKKKITALGAKLARALDHGQEQDITACYTEIVKGNEFLSNLVSTIRIKGTMSEADAAAHALYSSGQKNNKRNQTGANAVIDILVASGLVKNLDGQLTVLKSDGQEESSIEEVEEKVALLDERQIPSPPDKLRGESIPISINIELHLPATSDANVYKELFKALRNNLLSNADE